MFLFNPDNDLALADFGTHYTPPASAVKMAEDLAVLPLWYAPHNAIVVAEGWNNELFLSQIQKHFPIQSSIISFSGIPQFPKEEIIPWGWNPVLRNKLSGAGVSEEKLPSMEGLKRLHDYSGRQHAVKMLHELNGLRNDFCGTSHYFSSVDEVLHFLSSTAGNNVLKMPNSGSGKGLIWILGNITHKQTDWCRRVVRRQGGVVAEPVLKKVRDFAMEFALRNGKTEFVGYSLFQSAPSGAYAGNILLSDPEIENTLSQSIPAETLQWVMQFYRQKLPEYFPQYNGFLGVDMMVCETEKGPRLQPCVEMNLRMNMGLVAHRFRERFVHPRSRGRFAVDYFKKQGDALTFRQKMQKDFPFSVEKSKMVSGFLNLTPVKENTKYMAYVIIEIPSDH